MFSRDFWPGENADSGAAVFLRRGGRDRLRFGGDGQDGEQTSVRGQHDQRSPRVPVGRHAGPDNKDRQEEVNDRRRLQRGSPSDPESADRRSDADRPAPVNVSD